jgi:hypothetical protein
VVNPFKGMTVMIYGSTCPAGTTGMGGGYGAVHLGLDSFGFYPYKVQYDSLLGRDVLVKGADLMTMSACTVN